MTRVLLIVALAAAAAGCSTKIGIVRQRPAAVNLSPASRVVITASSREKSPQEHELSVGLMMENERRHDAEYPVRLLQSALNQRFQSGFWSLAPADRAQCGIHVKVTDWSHATEPWTPEATKEEPHPATSIRIVGRLNADATMACGHLGSKTILRSYTVRRELELKKQTVEAADHDKLLDKEINELASMIAREVTPQTYAIEVLVDDSSDLVKPAVDLLRDGDFDSAHALLESLVKTNPTCAPAHFNLGLIEEARGEFATARAHYENARRNGSSYLYDQGLARVDQASADLKAMAGQTPP